MQRVYKHISFEQKDDVFCVRIRQSRLDERDIMALSLEVLDLIEERGCRKMVLCLGPGVLDCLYSVFMATLVMIQKTLVERGGVLKLCEVAPETLEVFHACHLRYYFDFEPDQDTAVAILAN
jgi:anti-anti-sigma factor